MQVEPPRYTTACVLLKQPDKQKLANFLFADHTENNRFSEVS